ncbi:MAG: glycoside hydrolase 100 family protein [Pseudomonadota bacterium]
MSEEISAVVEDAKRAALEVLLYNARAGRSGLPRTAAWGYPEPYTRDLMIGAFGTLISGNEELVDSLRRTLQVLAQNQSPLGHIPSLVDVPGDRGASDTTPLFLIALAMYQSFSGDSTFLAEASHKAHVWLCYQSPEDNVLVTQEPTSDWRDEQWVEGSGLYVNTLVYCYLKLQHEEQRIQTLLHYLPRLDVRRLDQSYVHERLISKDAPYYALWAYKVANSERFDLLGNSLAILSGMASSERAGQIVDWVERECRALQEQGLLAVGLPPCLFPYIRPEDPDWRPRYARYNPPGCYHNGGIWPFVCGFWVSALVAAGRHELAREKLIALAEVVRPTRVVDRRFGFNEWLRAQDGQPRGQDWQSWSASMFLYAAECVARRSTPLFDGMRAPR